MGQQNETDPYDGILSLDVTYYIVIGMVVGLQILFVDQVDHLLNWIYRLIYKRLTRRRKDENSGQDEDFKIAIEGIAHALSYVVVNSGGLSVYVLAVMLFELAVNRTTTRSHTTSVKLVIWCCLDSDLLFFLWKKFMSSGYTGVTTQKCIATQTEVIFSQTCMATQTDMMCDQTPASTQTHVSYEPTGISTSTSTQTQTTMAREGGRQVVTAHIGILVERDPVVRQCSDAVRNAHTDNTTPRSQTTEEEDSSSTGQSGSDNSTNVGGVHAVDDWSPLQRRHEALSEDGGSDLSIPSMTSGQHPESENSSDAGSESDILVF